MVLVKKVGTTRRKLQGESSLADLSKPATAIRELVKPSVELQKTFDPREREKVFRRHFDLTKGGATPLERIYAPTEFSQSLEAELAATTGTPRTAAGPEMPIAGVTPEIKERVNLAGFQMTQKPYNMRCKSGHLIPKGANIYTDGRSYFCPNCGKPCAVM